jgi:hypothetical protein
VPDGQYGCLGAVRNIQFRDCIPILDELLNLIRKWAILGYNNRRLKFKEIWLMIVNSKNVEMISEKPMRITRIVSVILNGIVLSKLATRTGNDVNAMADTVMLNLTDNVQKNILSHEVSLVKRSLRKEIGRRMDLPQAV